RRGSGPGWPRSGRTRAGNGLQSPEAGTTSDGYAPAASSGTSWNGRTSTGAAQALVALAAQASASSRSAALMIQNPPSCSFVSANGPSVVRTSPSLIRTTVAVDGGCRPPANTQAPAASSSV